MGAGAIYPAEDHLTIEDSWIVDNASDDDAVIYCEYKDGKNPEHSSDAKGQTGLPRGVMIRGDAAGAGNAAQIRGCLWNENYNKADDYYIVAGVPISLRFKRIYANGTTARGIKVLY